MIVDFNCKETEKIWLGIISKKFPRNIQDIARRKLRMIHNSQTVIDLRIPPGNRLEKLSGNRKNQFSIRINNQWRICFMWSETDAYNVEIVDYH